MLCGHGVCLPCLQRSLCSFVWYGRNTLTNYVEVTKAGGTATITKVVFYRDVLGAAFTLLNTLTAAPFKVGFSVSDLDVNTVVNVVAAVTCSDGNVVYMTFSGRVREPNLSPTDIRVSVSNIQVCVLPFPHEGIPSAVGPLCLPLT